MRKVEVRPRYSDRELTQHIMDLYMLLLIMTGCPSYPAVLAG